MGNKLLLIRGLPGSGKSTLAKHLADTCGFFHVEADMWFSKDGDYKFIPQEIANAHDWCNKQAAFALENGKNVVVSNTFTQYWEIEPYESMARCLAKSFWILECTANYGSVHNVPDEAYQRMKNRWETL